MHACYVGMAIWIWLDRWLESPYLKEVLVCLFKTLGSRVEAPNSAGTPTEDFHPRSTTATQVGRLVGLKYH